MLINNFMFSVNNFTCAWYWWRLNAINVQFSAVWCGAAQNKVGRRLQLTKAGLKIYIFATSGFKLPTSGFRGVILPDLGKFGSQKFSRKLYFFVQFFCAVLTIPQTPAGASSSAPCHPKCPPLNSPPSRSVLVARTGRRGEGTSGIASAAGKSTG